MSDTPPPSQPPFVPKPAWLAACYMFASLLLAMTQQLGMNLISVNLPQIQGELGATQQEASWLMAAYMAPNVSLALALIKIRTQFGLRRFAEVSIAGFVIACLLNTQIDDLHSGIAVRFMSGIAAAPMSTMAFLYMLEPFPPAKKLSIGLSFALTGISLGAPMARLISPHLLEIGNWHALTVLELALAMVAFFFVYMLPLTPIPRAKVIERWDIASYLLIATGFGCLAVVLVMGRSFWWLEAQWIGVALAVSVVSIASAAVIELNRARPLLDIRWLTSPAILHFTAALLIFRLVLSEQSTGAAGFYQSLGLQNEQTRGIFAVILCATIMGGLVSAAVLKPGREPFIHLFALAILATGAFLDAHATNLTRPSQMMASQAMIAFAGAVFLPSALAAGLMSALKKGPQYILSFIIVFLTTQSLGGLAGSAIFSSLIQIRQAVHGKLIAADLAQTDPLVAGRIASYAGALARTLPDAAARQAQAMQLLGQTVQREATVMAYNDAFLIISLIAAGAFVILLGHTGLMMVERRRSAANANG